MHGETLSETVPGFPCEQARQNDLRLTGDACGVVGESGCETVPDVRGYDSNMNRPQDTLIGLLGFDIFSTVSANSSWRSVAFVGLESFVILHHKDLSVPVTSRILLKLRKGVLLPIGV